jgi:hypothetical protein
MSGKGSKPRPFSVNQETFCNNWDSIFKKKPVQDKQDEAIMKNEYYDVLTTEEALSEMVRVSEEMGAYIDEPIENPLIKK